MQHRLAERVCIPRLHRRSLVGGGERGEHRVAGVNVREVAFHDLRPVTLRRAAEIAAHRIDGLKFRVAQQLRCAAAIVLGERRPGKVALAVKIRDDVGEALGLEADGVRVRLRQKARGGITITATS